MGWRILAVRWLGNSSRRAIFWYATGPKDIFRGLPMLARYYSLEYSSHAIRDSSHNRHVAGCNGGHKKYGLPDPHGGIRSLTQNNDLHADYHTHRVGDA